MVRTVFGCGEREEAAAALCPPDYAARHYPVWRMGAGRGLATFLLASPLATLAPIQLGRTRKLDIQLGQPSVNPPRLVLEVGVTSTLQAAMPGRYHSIRATCVMKF